MPCKILNIWSGNGLSPILCQTIVENRTCLLSVKHSERYFNKSLLKFNIFLLIVWKHMKMWWDISVPVYPGFNELPEHPYCHLDSIPLSWLAAIALVSLHTALGMLTPRGQVNIKMPYCQYGNSQIWKQDGFVAVLPYNGNPLTRWPEIIGLYWNRLLNSINSYYLHCTGQATYLIYCQTSNIRHTLVGNKIVDHSDVVGYIFFLVLTPDFNFLGKDNCNTRWETF